MPLLMLGFIAPQQKRSASSITSVIRDRTPPAKTPAPAFDRKNSSFRLRPGKDPIPFTLFYSCQPMRHKLHSVLKAGSFAVPDLEWVSLAVGDENPRKSRTPGVFTFG